MARVLALKLDEPTRTALRAELAESGDGLEEVATLQELRLAQLDGGAAVVIVGAAVDEPIGAAQRLFLLAPDVPVIILSEPARQRDVSAAAQVAPFLSEQLRCLPSGQPEALRSTVRELVGRAGKARSFRQTVEALNARLASAPAPVTPPAVLEGIFDNAPIGIVIADADGRVRAWNKNAGELLSLVERAALGTKLEDLFLEEERERWRDFLAPLARHASPAAAREVFRRRPGARTLHLEVTGAPLSGSAGREPLLFLFQDVTDRVELLEQLREAIRVRDDFLSIASHELRTPMTSLQLQLHSIRRRQAQGEAIPAQLAAKLDTITRQVQRLEKLISDLLDVSRVRAGRLQLEWAEVDLAALAHEVAGRFEAEATVQSAPLVVTAPQPVVGWWDRGRLDQVLENLLANAIKFGAGAPVHVTVEAEGGRARLRVHDLGIGIGPEDQTRIFHRFERAVSNRHYGGFGLGLWICRQIVELLGGTIEVSSVLGGGATFTIDLPLTAGDERERVAAPGAP